MSIESLLNKKVLVVDDLASIREALIAVLKGMGFQDISEAVDGKDGFEKLKSCAESAPFDLIFSDINMPNCTGIEFVKLIRGSDHYKTVPIIMVSTENEIGIILETVDAGANNYILKPFNQETVTKKLVETYKKLNG